ncbi:MAG: hypothetical protein ACI9T8_000478 [Candidatus Saccharimonadales bacterium]|jgi:hypothetical protein
MKIIRLINEPVLAFVSLALTALLFATREVSMSDMTQMLLMGIFTAAILAYSALIFRESPADEREAEISLIASKHAYLVGSTILTVGIIVQSTNHELDMWLPAALSAMVIVKLISYFKQK